MNPHSVVIVSNASIKNHVVTSISYIYLYNSLVIKIIYYVVNILSTEAKLFVIRYGINQAVCISNINYIFVITNSNHAADRIFDSLLHLYQIHSLTISYKLRKFFQENNNKSIKFWNYLSKYKWSLYDTVNKETKKFDLTSIFPCRPLWNFSKK